MQDVIIIGGGPAGGSAAIYARRAGLTVMVIAHDSSALGKTDRIENYYGFEQPISGEELLNAGRRQAERLGVVWQYDEVMAINAEKDSVTVTGIHKSYTAKALILANGAPRAVPQIEGLRQHEGQGVSYCAVCDAFFYRGKDVAVLGSGRYALHEAADLLPVAKSVTLLTNGMPAPIDLPANLLADERKLRAIIGEDVVTGVAFENGDSLAVSGVFVAMGVAGSDALAKKLGVMTSGGHIIVDENMATNIPNVFAAGDCVGGLKQIVKAVHDGAVAGMSAAAFLRTQNPQKA